MLDLCRDQLKHELNDLSVRLSTAQAAAAKQDNEAAAAELAQVKQNLATVEEDLTAWPKDW